MPHVIAYLWIATVVVTIAVAAYRGIPIRQAFKWIDAPWGSPLMWGAVAASCTLLFLHLDENLFLLGQRPGVLGMLVLLIFAWVTVGFNLCKAP